jgi:hypothetical protein
MLSHLRGKLELHTTVDKATGKPEIRYWAHALPLLPRNCVNPKCGKEFTPEDIKKAHQECCSKPCIRIFAVRNWEKNHPEEARKLAKKSAERRRHFTNLGRQFASGQIQPQPGGNGKGQAVAGTKQKKNTGPKTGKKIGPELDQLEKQGFKWLAIKELMDEKTNTYRSIDAYQGLLKRWRARQQLLSREKPSN